MTATIVPSPPRASTPHRSGIEERAPHQRRAPERIAAALTLLALAGVAVAALIEIDISLPAMIESWSNAERFFTRVGGLSFPEWPELLELTGLTLGVVLCGTIFAAVVSVPVAYLAAENTTPGRAWRAAARFVGVFTRALPDVVLAMVFVLMFSFGSLPGILAIGIHSIGMISKMFADAIEQIDEGPRLAIRAAGGSKLQEFTSSVLPQVLPSWVATVLHRNDINLRGSVILGYVGVAGLGLEMSTAFKSLDYSLGLGIALVIFVLCVAMEVVSSLVRAAMLGGHEGSRTPIDKLVDRMRGSHGSETSRQNAGVRRFASPQEALRRPWNSTRIAHLAWGWAFAILVVAAVAFAEINWLDFFTFWARIPDIATQFWPPSFGVYDLATMLEAMRDTISIAFAAALLTFLVSLVIGSLAARNVAPTRSTHSGMRLLLVAIRGIPEVILAIVLIIITGLGTQAGTIALAIGGIGLLGKLIADSLEEVRRGPETALRSTGATRVQTYASATLPQGTPALIGHTFYLLDTNIRAATLLGIVGGGGVGYYLLNAGQGSNYPLVTAIVLMILVTVLMVEGIAMWMRRVFR